MKVTTLREDENTFTKQFVLNACHTAGFWKGVPGFMKALVWPAFVVYELMKHLAM